MVIRVGTYEGNGEVVMVADWNRYVISKEIEFDMGHRVPNHKSKCRNPHGHRYRVRARITGTLVTTPGHTQEGMLADFGDLKMLLTELIHDPLDHGFMLFKNDSDMWDMFGMYEFTTGPEVSRKTDYGNERGYKVIVVPFIPTAENLSKWSFDQLAKPVEAMGFTLQGIDLWETPTSIATYERQ